MGTAPQLNLVEPVRFSALESMLEEAGIPYQRKITGPYGRYTRPRQVSDFSDFTYGELSDVSVTYKFTDGSGSISSFSIKTEPEHFVSREQVVSQDVAFRNAWIECSVDTKSGLFDDVVRSLKEMYGLELPSGNNYNFRKVIDAEKGITEAEILSAIEGIRNAYFALKGVIASEQQRLDERLTVVLQGIEKAKGGQR